MDEELQKQHNALTEKLKSVVAKYLDDRVRVPALDTISNDFVVQDGIADVLRLLQILEQQLREESPGRLDQFLLTALPKYTEKAMSLSELFGLLPEDAKSNVEARTIYFSYLDQLFHWIAVSILSANYISTYVLLRTLLELLVNTSADAAGTMSEKVKAIRGFTDEERREIAHAWRELSGWAHPYGRWLNQVCPVYVSKGPRYFPRLARECTDKLKFCADFAVSISVEMFGMDPAHLASSFEDSSINIENFPMLSHRATT